MEALENIPEPPKIRVVVRKRPMTQREGQSQDIVDVEGVGELIVKEIKWVQFLLKVLIFAPWDRPSFTSFFFIISLSFLNSKPLVWNFFPYRMKVDLTKYIEEHLFSFDNAYNDDADN